MNRSFGLRLTIYSKTNMGLTNEHFYTSELNYSAKIFRTLAHPCRIRIIGTLLVHDYMTVGEMTEQFNGPSQSSLSEHLRHLKDAGLISGTKVETTIRYSLNGAIWEHVKWVLTTVANDNELVMLYQ
ncbi:MAG: ArsR family transcriptional regulator [Chitinophagaceae bacterium]|nr:MAG: ArsR family transcriptional regulator [Chitinophagaceae bacterium]